MLQRALSASHRLSNLRFVVALTEWPHLDFSFIFIDSSLLTEDSISKEEVSVQSKYFHIHGDNIVECVRAFDYVVSGLGDDVISISGPSASITCPVYTVSLKGEELIFQFLPGYGENRWNQDVLAFVKRSGGRLREAADAIITLIENDEEAPVAAIEFCGALPAGNQAWQRQGRAFSFAHAEVPYFYVAELGGFELDSDRGRKAERMPNPAIPFSFFTMTQYRGSVCLPVYEANAGATSETIRRFGPIFGKLEFLEFLKQAVLGEKTDQAASNLGDKCVALVKLLADSRKRQDGLTSGQWEKAHEAALAGKNLIDFLCSDARLEWKKTASIKSLTDTAKSFMAMGAKTNLGLTSKALPLSFVPKDRRAAFSAKAKALYPDLSPEFEAWLAGGNRHLAISWVMGFKPRGDDARPDRGLPPLARMLIGDDCELMTFVYGPAPIAHWNELAANPVGLAERNGLWEAVLGVSDAVLVDSSTKPSTTPRGYLKASWAAALNEEDIPLHVEARVRSFGEQDVDTALHVAFESLGAEVVFEGMCNPPGGDWSGISFRWGKEEPEHRWLTLPRVSADGAKRPDHVFSVFGHGDRPICLCIESKELAKALDPNIGPRLTRYTEALFDSAPSINRIGASAPWAIFKDEWRCRELDYVSAGAYLATADDPFRGVPSGSNLDVQIGVEFATDGKSCTLHLRGDSNAGRALVDYLVALPNWGAFVSLKVSN